MLYLQVLSTMVEQGFLAQEETMKARAVFVSF